MGSGIRLFVLKSRHHCPLGKLLNFLYFRSFICKMRIIVPIKEVRIQTDNIYVL